MTQQPVTHQPVTHQPAPNQPGARRPEPEGAKERPTRGARRRTLRFRLTAGIVALLTAAAVTIGVLTAVGLHRFLVDQLDLQLDAAHARVVDSLHGSGEDDDQHDGRPAPGQDGLGEVPGLPAGSLIVRFGEETAEAYVIASGAQPISDADVAALASLPSSGEPVTVELPAGDYRVVVQPSGDDGEALLVGLPLHDLDETMTRLIAIEIAVFAVVISLAGLLAALFVGRSLEPLRRVAGTATRVARLPLGSGAVAMPERAPTSDPESEVGQVAGALNVLLDHVETSLGERQATEERLRRFVADASHELRTPVSVISGYTQLAQRQSADLPPVVATSLDHIGAEADRMTTLVDDLLLLARLDSGRPLAREPVDLSRLAIDVVDGARAAGPDHRWQLDLPEDPVVVVGDEQRLRQVLVNLAANARSHTPAGTTVSVALRQTGPGEVHIEVVDDGPGIPDALQPELFERFVRGEASRSRAAGSTGLGLAIVAAVAAAHRGSVGVDSVPGRTRFVVRLPVAAGAPAQG